MKLSSIAALLLAASPFMAFANFAVYEGVFDFTSDSTEAPTSAEKLFLDSCLMNAINEANPDADFTAEAVETSDPEIVERRALRSQGDRKLPYGDTDWTAGTKVGGGCTFCIPGRRNLLLGTESAVSALACNHLQNGPFAKFQSATNCQLALVLAEPSA